MIAYVQLVGHNMEHNLLSGLTMEKFRLGKFDSVIRYLAFVWDRELSENLLNLKRSKKYEK